MDEIIPGPRTFASLALLEQLTNVNGEMIAGIVALTEVIDGSIKLTHSSCCDRHALEWLLEMAPMMLDMGAADCGRPPGGG